MQPQTQATQLTPQTIPQIAPIDSQPMIEHGTEPVSIILAIAILISILFRSITELVQIIVILILRQTKPSNNRSI
jgi:hypothetical protein